MYFQFVLTAISKYVLN